MNAGKLVAQIAVIAIIAYCCYDAVATAIPTDVRSLDDAFHVGEDFGVQTSSSDGGVTMDVTVSGTVTSGLPQDLKDVFVNIYFGEKGNRLRIANAEVGTIKAKGDTFIDATSKVPTYAIMAYAVSKVDDSGKLIIPMVISVGFKYMEWQGSYLIDLGVDVKQDLEVASGIPVPNFGPGDGPSSAKMEMTLDKNDDTIAGIAETILGGDTSKAYEFTTSNGASFSVSIEKNGEDKLDLSINASGTSDKNAYQLLQEALDANGGTLSLEYGGNQYELTEENADTFINMVKELYGKVPTS